MTAVRGVSVPGPASGHANGLIQLPGVPVLTWYVWMTR